MQTVIYYTFVQFVYDLIILEIFIVSIVTNIKIYC